MRSTAGLEIFHHLVNKDIPDRKLFHLPSNKAVICLESYVSGLEPASIAGPLWYTDVAVKKLIA